MIRILHTADLHLDSPFRGLTPEKARQRRREQRELLLRLQTAAVEGAVDMVLIAGDLFDGDGVYYETTQLLAETFGRIPARIFIAPGNHDPWSEHSPYAAVRWPENVHLFQSEGVERVELPDLKCVVYGTAFTSKYRDASPLEHFRPGYDDGMTRLMVLHGDLFSPRSRYGPLTPQQLSATGMDYIALGHVHRRTDLLREGKTCYAYCGCPEGRGFDETGDKGIYLGSVAPGEVDIKFIPLARRRYWDIPVDITDADPVQALAGALVAGAEEDICRFRLTGTRTGELPAAALTAQVQGRFFDVQIQDETVPAVDLWARAEEDNLTGIFLRRMRQRIEGAPPEERPTLEKAARFGLWALEGREEPQ